MLKKRIGISSCLIGSKVRYDGKDQYHRLIVDSLTEEYELVPFCPEVAIGLGVPRPKIQLVEVNGQIACLDELTHQIDYTEQLNQCCEQQSWFEGLSGYIFKTKSPSCGLSKVKTDYQGEIIANGQGIFARRLHQLLPELPLIEEDQFNDQKIRRDFLAAVSRYNKCYIQNKQSPNGEN